MISPLTDDGLTIPKQIKETMSFTYQLLAPLVQHTVQGIVSHCHFVIGVTPLHNLIQITKSLNRSITAQLATSLSGDQIHLGQAKDHIVTFQRCSLQIRPSQFVQPPYRFSRIFILLQQLPAHIPRISQHLLRIFLSDKSLLIAIPVQQIPP